MGCPWPPGRPVAPSVTGESLTITAFRKAFIIHHSKNLVVVSIHHSQLLAASPFKVNSTVLPSGKHTTKLRKITIFNGKTHYKLPFSIAFCMFTRQGKSICQCLHTSASHS